jgi:hypothetical protein
MCVFCAKNRNEEIQACELMDMQDDKQANPVRRSSLTLSSFSLFRNSYLRNIIMNKLLLSLSSIVVALAANSASATFKSWDAPDLPAFNSSTQVTVEQVRAETVAFLNSGVGKRQASGNAQHEAQPVAPRSSEDVIAEFYAACEMGFDQPTA